MRTSMRCSSSRKLLHSAGPGAQIKLLAWSTHAGFTCSAARRLGVSACWSLWSPASAPDCILTEAEAVQLGQKWVLQGGGHHSRSALVAGATFDAAPSETRFAGREKAKELSLRDIAAGDIVSVRGIKTSQDKTCVWSDCWFGWEDRRHLGLHGRPCRFSGFSSRNSLGLVLSGRARGLQSASPWAGVEGVVWEDVCARAPAWRAAEPGSAADTAGRPLSTFAAGNPPSAHPCAVGFWLPTAKRRGFCVPASPGAGLACRWAGHGRRPGSTGLRLEVLLPQS